MPYLLNASRVIINNQKTHIAVRIVLILGILLLFLFAIELMTMAFGFMSQEIIHGIFYITANPFIGLFIGLLATSIIQSSSTTTSMVVAMVASGAISVSHAVPIIIGANIGTTITSTIAALAHITKRKEFRKAMAAATLHDFFNILVTIIILPLEYYTGFMTAMALGITHFFASLGLGFFSAVSFPDTILRRLAVAVALLLDQQVVLLLVFSITCLLASIRIFSHLLKNIFIGRYRQNLQDVVFGSPLKALSWGALMTAAVQSSSVTSTLVVPLVATSRISLKKAFPFLMGANIGTTFTSLLAAFYKSDAAISIALVHLIFNLIGVLLFLPIPALRNIPIRLAKKLGIATMQNRIVGLIYIVIIFFIIPFLLIYSSKNGNWASEQEKEKMPFNIITEDKKYVPNDSIKPQAGQEEFKPKPD
ncbi:MAG: Na/Pi symporter [Bernardetiaceae bacterium]|nr:Na/Pi symporter [Bernardetiaceae bacterium]